MKLGLGFYRHALTAQNFRFARQLGCTHIVAHWTDYFKEESRIPDSKSTGPGWGVMDNREKPWVLEDFVALKKSVNAEGLELAALENFDPSHWYDILLDGPNKKAQIEQVKNTIRILGKAGIPVMGYNFSLAGVWGHVVGPWARGGAESVAFLGPEGPEETPIPNGMVWNMVYDAGAPPGTLPHTTTEQFWQRLNEFLQEVLPVAEEAGVKLALHPDDPPMPTLRGTPRLVYRPELYQQVIDLNPSPSNCLEFCAGSVAEMADGPMDVYQAVDKYSRQGRIAYFHFRNVKGKVPKYYEVFVDEGDVDMIRLLRILDKNGYDGVIVPDHTPQVACAAPWHAGMAFVIGYLRAALTIIEEGR